MAEFIVVVAAGECKEICLDTLQEPVAGIQSGVVENASGQVLGRITSAACLLLMEEGEYTVIASDNCGVLGVIETAVPCPAGGEPFSFTNDCDNPISVALCDPEELITGITSPIVEAITDVPPEEQKISLSDTCYEISESEITHNFDQLEPQEQDGGAIVSAEILDFDGAGTDAYVYSYYTSPTNEAGGGVTISGSGPGFTTFGFSDPYPLERFNIENNDTTDNTLSNFSVAPVAVGGGLSLSNGVITAIAGATGFIEFDGSVLESFSFRLNAPGEILLRGVSNIPELTNGAAHTFYEDGQIRYVDKITGLPIDLDAEQDIIPCDDGIVSLGGETVCVVNKNDTRTKSCFTVTSSLINTISQLDTGGIVGTDGFTITPNEKGDVTSIQIRINNVDVVQAPYEIEISGTGIQTQRAIVRSIVGNQPDGFLEPGVTRVYDLIFPNPIAVTDEITLTGVGAGNILIAGALDDFGGELDAFPDGSFPMVLLATEGDDTYCMRTTQGGEVIITEDSTGNEVSAIPNNATSIPCRDIEENCNEECNQDLADKIAEALKEPTVTCYELETEPSTTVDITGQGASGGNASSAYFNAGSPDFQWVATKDGEFGAMTARFISVGTDPLTITATNTVTGESVSYTGVPVTAGTNTPQANILFTEDLSYSTGDLITFDINFTDIAGYVWRNTDASNPSNETFVWSRPGQINEAGSNLFVVEGRSNLTFTQTVQADGGTTIVDGDGNTVPTLPAGAAQVDCPPEKICVDGEVQVTGEVGITLEGATAIANAIAGNTAAPIDNTALLTQIRDELTGIDVNTDGIETLLSTLDSDDDSVPLAAILAAITTAIMELQDIDANTDTVETLLTSLLAEEQNQPTQTHTRVSGQDTDIPAGTKSFTVKVLTGTVIIAGVPFTTNEVYSESATEVDNVRAVLPALAIDGNNGTFAWIAINPVTEV